MAFTTIPELDEKALKRFTDKIDFGGEDQCWNWTASGTRKEGYGFISIKGRLYLSHRVMFFVANGSISPNMEIDHLCVNPSCVNPKHLEEVTGTVNRQRQAARIRARKEADKLAMEAVENEKVLV